MEGAAFNYALDAASASDALRVLRGPMPEPWAWGLDAPVKILVSAIQFDWQPTELQPLPAAPIEGGRPAPITLVPYGCTRFRVSMFPVSDGGSLNHR